MLNDNKNKNKFFYPKLISFFKNNKKALKCEKKESIKLKKNKIKILINFQQKLN